MTATAPTVPGIWSTRREILKAVVDAARARAKVKLDGYTEEYRRLQRESQEANTEMQEIAKSYGTKKIKKLVHPDFPFTQVFCTVELEKVNNSAKFKKDGKATIRLVLLDGDRQEMQLPADVRAAMEEANTDSERLQKESQVAWRKYKDYQYQMQKLFTGHDNPDYQKLLGEVLPTLGPDAAPHLDALIEQVEKALANPPKPVNQTPAV